MANLKLASFDAEFYGVREEILNLVCLTITYGNNTKEFWLHKDHNAKEKCAAFIKQLNVNGYIFLTYQAVAEARTVYSLGIDPMTLRWIDLFLEYRCLTNHNDNMMYGKHLVDGKVKVTKRPPPKWQRTDADNAMAFKPKCSLAEATYKLLGIIRDTEHKTAMRDLIISAPKEFTPEEQSDIMRYCTEDVVYLKPMYDKVCKEYKRLFGDGGITKKELKEDMLLRGAYSALTAIRESKGYPIDYEKTRNFSNSVAQIIEECQRDINSQFPDMKVFKYKLSEARYTWNQKATREWLENNVDVNKWLKTDKKALSLSKDAFEREFPYRHDYPRGNFGAQILRYLKLKQSLNGFVPNKKNSFWDYVGEDRKVRPYMNIYGSQSSRSQPRATGFIMLKPAWQRALVVPPAGWALTSIDYASEEFFISALLSEDIPMQDSYISGDPYFNFAKLSGMVPMYAVKEDYPNARNLCKATTLGLSYDMSCHGLATKLTADTGKTYTPDQAQELINTFFSTFSEFASYKRKIQTDYEDNGSIILHDGWAMWGENDNKRSVGNCPIQGAGAVIMRNADFKCNKKGLYVPFTLHDALYILHPADDLSAIDTAMECMTDGFVEYFEKDQQEKARKIRLDVDTWGPSFNKGQIITTPKGVEVSATDIYIDKRAKADYEKFSKYFTPNKYDGLL